MYRRTTENDQAARKALIGAFPVLAKGWHLRSAEFRSRCVACSFPIVENDVFFHNGARTFGTGSSCHLACAYRIANIQPECLPDEAEVHNADV